MYDKLISKKNSLAVIGLGYVGLPIALEFAKKIKVIGFDVRKDRIELMKKKIDPSNELPATAFEKCNIHFTANPEELRAATCYIVAVPTPIDEHNLPDLNPLLKATRTVGKVLKKGDYVIYESTVYPGCTEEDCVPILERESRLKFVKDFKVGYSPERINPGDREHTLTKIIKVVSGCDDASCDNIAKIYAIVVKAGIHKAQSIKVAEAAKIIENTQRDVNIALMNELSMIFNLMGINTYDVLRAAGTKWNFLRFIPGLVGGHCIGVDPYYLTYKAREYGFHAKMINSGRAINDGMGVYIAKETLRKIIASEKNIRHSRVLVMGITFKENVSDIRNSKVVDLINELKSFMINVEVVDPYASPEEVKKEYGIDLNKKIGKNYDAVILAVSHKEYMNLDTRFFRSISSEKGILIDLKGLYKQVNTGLSYWSL